MWRSKIVTMVILLLLPQQWPVNGEELSALQCERNIGNFNMNLDLSCADFAGTSLWIISALWGRDTPASIIDSTEHYCPEDNGVGDQVICTSPENDVEVLKLVRARCEEKTSCSIEPTISLLSDPCVGVYKYLQVKYVCANLECSCSLDGATNYLDVYDWPTMYLWQAKQKTLMTSYHNDKKDPCKFKMQVITNLGTPPAIQGLQLFVGEHKKNTKFMRNYKISQNRIEENGAGVKDSVTIVPPYQWVSGDEQTKINFVIENNHILVRSSTCPYAFDIDITDERLSVITYVDKRQGGDLIGMCKNCDDISNGYTLSDGTPVDGSQNIFVISQQITKSYDVKVL